MLYYYIVFISVFHSFWDIEEEEIKYIDGVKLRRICSNFLGILENRFFFQFRKFTESELTCAFGGK